jgi:hypothetical protein
MQAYKDSNNKLHVIDDEKFEYLLPKDCVKISQAEADELIKSTPEQVKAEKDAKVKSKIDELELKSLRAMREALLTNDKVNLEAIEAEIVTEREKLERKIK